MASNVVEKKAFVVCLYRMVHKYLPRNRPEFVHFDEERLHELLATAEAGGRGREIEEVAVQQGMERERERGGIMHWGIVIAIISNVMLLLLVTLVGALLGFFCNFVCFIGRGLSGTDR